MSSVVLLTDFGLVDHYVGVVHAVVAREAPGVDRLDLTHELPAGDVWGACFRLRCAVDWLPDDAVVLAVVDPGVGTGRRAVAARVGRRWIVAPDNGLASALGPVDEAVELAPDALGLRAPSATFHGRDLFAPAAAHLARGDMPRSVGRPVDPASLVPNPLPDPEPTTLGCRGVVLHVDRFGNVVTNIPVRTLPEGTRVVAGDAAYDVWVRAYADGSEDEVVLLEGSSGLLELAVHRGSAAEMTGLDRGDPIEVVAR